MEDAWARSWLAALAAIVVTVGASIVEPTAATAAVVLAAAMAITATLLPGAIVGRIPFDDRSVVRLITAGLLIMWITGVIGAPVLEGWFILGFSIAICVGMASLWTAGRVSVILALGSIGAQVVLASSMVATLPRPADQDVDLFPRDASAALTRGENPYAITYPNIYGQGTPLYSEEVQDGDRLLVGYPYPPLSLLAGAAGEVIAGDHRYAAAAAVGLTSLLLMLCGPGPAARGAALILVSSPLAFRVIYNGWSEPLIVPFLAGTVLASLRAPPTAPWTLGLAVAGKQYAALLLLTGVVLLRGVRDRVGLAAMGAIGTVVAASTIVPFLLWDPAAFIRSVVEFHVLQPVRPEAVSIPGLLARLDLVEVPAWTGFLAAALTMAAVLRWAPRTPSGFVLGSASVYFVFFLTSKQAFMNYYFFIMVALLAAVAAARPTSAERHPG